MVKNYIHIGKKIHKRSGFNGSAFKVPRRA
jgi:hypothetical protein